MSDNDLWYVKTADGDVNRVTLDQLDEAFNAGQIDENVMVLPAGEETWVKLGALLGLDQPAPAALPPTPAAFALPPSLRPVSLDLSSDLDDPPFKKKSRKGAVIGAMIGAAAIAGVAFAAIRGAHADSGTATAAVAPPPVAAPAPPPPPVVPTPAATTTAAPLPDHGLSDDQKAKLAAADKARDDKAKSKKKARGTGNPSHGGGKIKSQGFTTSGNKFDPLNANL